MRRNCKNMVCACDGSCMESPVVGLPIMVQLVQRQMDMEYLRRELEKKDEIILNLSKALEQQNQKGDK